MILYEIRAYRTKAYDRASEEVVRLKDHALWPAPRVLKWVQEYLAKFADGKVRVSVFDKRSRWRRQGRRLIHTFPESP